MKNNLQSHPRASFFIVQNHIKSQFYQSPIFCFPGSVLFARVPPKFSFRQPSYMEALAVSVRKGLFGSGIKGCCRLCKMQTLCQKTILSRRYLLDPNLPNFVSSELCRSDCSYARRSLSCASEWLTGACETCFVMCLLRVPVLWHTSALRPICSLRCWNATKKSGFVVYLACQTNLFRGAVLLLFGGFCRLEAKRKVYLAVGGL